MKTRDRIHKIYNKIRNRLSPKHDVGVKVYSNIYNLLRGYARSKYPLRTYEQITKNYDDYLDKMKNGRKKDYIQSKYKIGKEHNDNARREVFKIVAISTEPISIVKKAFKGVSDRTIAFYLLHEIAHIVFSTHNERRCDLYAGRWVKTLVKERILK